MHLSRNRMFGRAVEHFTRQLSASRIGHASLWFSLATCAIFLLQRFWSIDFELRAGLLSWGSLTLIGSSLTLAMAGLSLIAEKGKLSATLAVLLLCLIETYFLPLIVVMIGVNFIPELLFLTPALLGIAFWLRRRRVREAYSVD
jgi:hypothetical protein